MLIYADFDTYRTASFFGPFSLAIKPYNDRLFCRQNVLLLMLSRGSAVEKET